MIRTVTALFDDTGDAEAAMTQLSRRLPVMKAGIVTCGPGEKPDFGSIFLSRGQREACEAELAEGGSLLIAQVEGNESAEQAVELLDRISQGLTPDPTPVPQPAPTPAPRRGAAPPVPPTARAAPTPIPADRVEGVPISTLSRRTAPEPEPMPEPAPQAPPPVQAQSQPEPQPQLQSVSEDRVPVVEEELRIGKRTVARGGARVHSYMEEVPVTESVELIEERIQLERRPVNRLLSEEEIAASGLLQDRVVEVTQMREEAVLTKEAVVREELVVKKTVERRVEQIQDTVRRTAVEVERLEPELAGAAAERRS